MTGTLAPAALFATTRLAYGRPVFSSTGSASISVRSITVGPGPLRITATTPVFPTPVVTSYPSARRRSASFADVCCSWNDSSGLRCKSRYSASASG
jgi:hypothetical protein